MDILNQRFNYARIGVVKDYTKIGLESAQDIRINDNDVFTLESSISPVFDGKAGFKTIRFTEPPEKGPKTKYYYQRKNTKTEDSEDSEDKNHTRDNERITLENLLKNNKKKNWFDGIFETTKDRHIKKHFINPFASISLHTIERSVKIVDGKLYVKAYQHIKYRELNCKFFRKNTNVHSITFDLNKGDIVCGDIELNSKTKRKKYRKNNFPFIETITNGNSFFNFANRINQNSPIYDECKSILDDREFLRVILENINQKDEELTQVDSVENKKKIISKIVSFFAERKKIKVPNDYQDLITDYYPGEKFLKKNGRKLIQSILDSFGMKSKLGIKILHENTNLDLVMFAEFCAFFGRDYPKYIGSIERGGLQFFEKTKKGFIATVPIGSRFQKINVDYVPDTQTKENIIKVFNSLVVSNTSKSRVNGFSGLIRDHISMISKLIEYYPDIKFNATTYDNFHIEHMEFTKLIELIRKGWSTEYQFDNRMIRGIETEIKTVFGDKEYVFKPIILKRDEEYSEEGAYMHHCVAGYSNKLQSLIISLRSEDFLERVTNEFDKKTGTCLQSRYFSNQPPPEHFVPALEILKKRVEKFKNQRLLDHIDVKKVRVKINGKEVPVPERRNAQDNHFVELIYNNGLEF